VDNPRKDHVVTADALDATVAAIREVGRKVNAARADQADAVELLRRAAPIAAMWRAKRIAAYSPDDIAALTSFSDLVRMLTAAQEQR
jgi:hypothetical protein